MAKFKVGDKVTDGNSVFQITKVNPDDYGWKLVKGDGKDVSGKSISAGGMISWADQKMREAANAKFKKGDRVKVKISGKTYIGKVGGTYGRGDYFVDFDKQLVTSDGVKVGKDWLFNESQLTLANAVTSKNPVVANAVAWKAKNARHRITASEAKNLKRGEIVFLDDILGTVVEELDAGLITIQDRFGSRDALTPEEFQHYGYEKF